MIVPVVLFTIGLILICIGGDRFVDSAVVISEKMGISKIVIGATVVSIGTTLPEVLVSTTAAFSGSASIAAGNALGSIICNTALIAGLSQLIAPTKGIDPKSFNWRMLFFFGTGAGLVAIGFLFRSYSRIVGVALLILFVVYALLTIRESMNGTPAEDSEEGGSSIGKALAMLVICAAALFAGARLLVNNGIVIAEELHVPERVIAVTFIALGTSLPELVTTVTSLIKGHTDMGLGNIIGANLLNYLLVIGIPSAIAGMELEEQTYKVDGPMGLLVMLLLTLPFVIRKRGYRLQGGLLVAVYFIYCIAQV